MAGYTEQRIISGKRTHTYAWGIQVARRKSNMKIYDFRIQSAFYIARRGK